MDRYKIVGECYLLDLDFPLLQQRNGSHDEVRLDSIRRGTAHHQSERRNRFPQAHLRAVLASLRLFTSKRYTLALKPSLKVMACVGGGGGGNVEWTYIISQDATLVLAFLAIHHPLEGKLLVCV